MRKVNYITPFVLVVASVQFFISVSARADSELIEKLDLDKDGQITIKEAVANPAVLASFGKIDTDGNGKISSFELAKMKVTLVKDDSTSKSADRI
jgi:Ca2+-binding EF-hand superfamily protein